MLLSKHVVFKKDSIHCCYRNTDAAFHCEYLRAACFWKTWDEWNESLCLSPRRVFSSFGTLQHLSPACCACLLGQRMKLFLTMISKAQAQVRRHRKHTPTRPCLFCLYANPVEKTPYRNEALYFIDERVLLFNLIPTDGAVALTVWRESSRTATQFCNTNSGQGGVIEV